MGVTNELPPKRDVAIALLEASSVYVHLDPRAAGVMVPAWFKKQPQLVLQVGLNMPVPIPDLDVGEEAISCTLSFNRRPEYCRIPWSAVYGLVGEDGRGMIWPEDVPPEVAAQAQGRAAAPKEQRRLRAVPEAGAPEEKAEEAAKEPSASADKPSSADKSAAERPEVAARSKPEGARAQKARASSKRAQAEAQPAKPSAPSAEAPSAKAPEAKSPQAKTSQAKTPQAEATPDTASDAEREGAGAGRAKRELPPYLRVVK